MSRSKKTRLRKLKARMHETNQELAVIRKALAHQNDELINYVGGAAEFGHHVLTLISRAVFLIGKDDPPYRQTDHAQFAIAVLHMAVSMGFVEPYQQSGRYLLTHMCKQHLGVQDGEAKAPHDGD